MTPSFNLAENSVLECRCCLDTIRQIWIQNQDEGIDEQALHASRRNAAEMASYSSGVRPQAVPRGITYALARVFFRILISNHDADDCSLSWKDGICLGYAQLNTRAVRQVAIYSVGLLETKAIACYLRKNFPATPSMEQGTAPEDKQSILVLQYSC